MQDNIKQSQWALESNKIEYLKELLQESDSKLKLRNKFIKNADSSEVGCKTVLQYEANPVASDSEDEYKSSRRNLVQSEKRKMHLRPNFLDQLRPVLLGVLLFMVLCFSIQRRPDLLYISSQHAIHYTIIFSKTTAFSCLYRTRHVARRMIACGDLSNIRGEGPYYSAGTRQPRPALPALQAPPPPTGK